MRRLAPIYAAVVALVTAWSVGCRAQAPPAALSPREEFRQLVIGGRKPAPLNPQSLSQSDVGTVRVERVRFTPEEGQDAIAVIYRQKDAQGRRPAVIVQHFLGGSKDHIGLLPLLNGLAQKGFVAAAIDGRYRGDRQNGKTLEAAIVESLRTGKGRPWLLDTTYDITRLIDYLQTRPDVDADRIGMTGFSEGGIETWMTAVVDDRVKVAAPIIGVTVFGEAMSAEENGPDTMAKLALFDPILRQYAMDLGEQRVTPKVLRTAWEKLVPGSMDRLDAPVLVPYIAPRPLLILNHELDELIPVAGARKVYEVTRKRYEELDAADRLQFQVLPGRKHADLGGLFANANTMNEWMQRWLKP